MRYPRRIWVIRTLIAAAVLALVYLQVLLCLSSGVGAFLFPDQWARRQQRASQEPFTFYGKVVDASGQSIEGAELDLVVLMPGSTPNQEEHVVVTDHRGRFELTDKGSGLWVMEVRGAGHLLHDRFGPADSDAIKYNHSFSFSRTGATFTYVPDPSRPAIFVVVEHGDLIKVWPSRGGEDTHFHRGITLSNQPLRPENPSVDIIDTPQGPVAGDVYNQATRRYPGRE